MREIFGTETRRMTSDKNRLWVSSGARSGDFSLDDSFGGISVEEAIRDGPTWSCVRRLSLRWVDTPKGL